MWIPASSLVTLLAQKLLGSTAEPSLSHPTYPNHTLLALNDGNFLPSPAFGVGSALYQKDAKHDVLLALETGYRHIDNAAIYANEESVGAAIRSGGVKREDLYITTKYDAINGSDVETEFHSSLKKVCKPDPYRPPISSPAHADCVPVFSVPLFAIDQLGVDYVG
jgi:hypothetical protein